MYVRMAFWRCKEDCWGEDAELFASRAISMMRTQDGFIRAMLLGVERAGQRIALTVWESPDAYRRFEQSRLLEEITSMFAHMYVDGKPPGPIREYVVRAEGGAE